MYILSPFEASIIFANYYTFLRIVSFKLLDEIKILKFKYTMNCYKTSGLPPLAVKATTKKFLIF